MAEAGADYTSWFLEGADHALPRIDDALLRSHGGSVAQKSAEFFGLVSRSRRDRRGTSSSSGAEAD